jgi:hypothetical protein
VDIPEKVNKAMDGDTSINKTADTPTRVTAASRLTQDYFFPGGGVWKPMTVRASDRQEAEEIHRRKREPASPPAETEKVGDSKESN